MNIIRRVAGFLATVLICDDEPFLRELIRASLNGDYQIAEAVDGIDCMTAVRKVRPDVVILDILMPRSSGLDVLEAFRQDASLADIPVIVLTAQPESREEARRAGASMVIDKPFTPDDISTAVEEVLAGRR